MSSRMRLLFIAVLIALVFLILILTSVEYNERAVRTMEVGHHLLRPLDQLNGDQKAMTTVNVKTTSATISVKTTSATIRSRFVRVLKLGNGILPTEQGMCADIVCSNFLTSTDMKCAKTIFARLETASVTPKCHFQNGTMKPLVLIRSFPGSGNTWTRELLEKTSGICTGSIYCDAAIWKSGMVGEGVKSKSVLVVKTHNLETRGDATVAIIRNPANTILAYWKWYITYHSVMYKVNKGKAHVNNPPPFFFGNNTKWNTFINKELYRWMNLIKGELLLSNRTKHPLLIVRYEDIKENASKEVFHMLDFLNVNYSANEVINRLEEAVTTFKRPKPPHEFDPYTLQQREKIESVLRELLKWSQENCEVTLSQIVEDYLLQNSRIYPKTLAQS